MKNQNDALIEQIKKTFNKKGKVYAKAPRIIKLHCAPNAIRESIRELIEMSEDEGMKNLFVDIDVLVNWALNRLPVMTKDESHDSPNAEVLNN